MTKRSYRQLSNWGICIARQLLSDGYAPAQVAQALIGFREGSRERPAVVQWVRIEHLERALDAENALADQLAALQAQSGNV